MYLSLERLPGYFYCEKIEYEKGDIYPTRKGYASSVAIFVLSGVLRFTENSNKTEVNAGCYYIQRDNTILEGNLECDEPELVIVEFAADYTTNGGIPITGNFDTDIIIPLLDKLIDAEKTVTSTYFLKTSLFLHILDVLYNSSNHERNNTLPYKIAQYIHRRFKSNITINDIEKEFSYSANYIINIFKSEFDVTPHQYIKKLRLDASKQLIMNTSKSIEQIAFDCGYTNFTTFFRNFTETFGATPSSWRKTMAQRKK